MDATTCSTLCGHPGCWATRRRQNQGLARSLPPLKLDDDSSDDEISLPTQSICNLLDEYGESPMDRYPLSTGGRPSHDIGMMSAPRGSFSAHSLDSGFRLGVPHNTTASVLSKKPQQQPPKRQSWRNPHLRLVEVQEVFDRDDLQARWDETFVTKQYFVWMPNPTKQRRQIRDGYKHETGISTAQTNPVLVKDMTENMIPFEIEQRREETVLKKQPRNKSPPAKTIKTSQEAHEAILDGPIDREGINELLALPKDTLMKVLEHTKKSDFTSPGRLHSIVQHIARDDERARLALGARHSFKHKELQAADKRHIPVKPGAYYYEPPSTRQVYQLDTNMDDDHGIIDRLSSINTPQNGQRRPARPESEADSVDMFPRYGKPLPGIKEQIGHPKPAVKTQKVLHYRGKIPSISLGLPELPTGLKTTKAFNYRRQEVDFSLGPVITPPSSYRSSDSRVYSEHGTTLKVNVSSTMPGIPGSHYRDDDQFAIHSVSPALSTNVPVPPAGTPATFAHGSPTKSAPAAPLGHLQQQLSWDQTRVTINWSQSALPPSRGDVRGDSEAVNRMIATPQADATELVEERALDTIKETAREIQPTVEAHQDNTEMDHNAKQQETETLTVPQPQQPILQLERSTLKRIGAVETPRQKSARSVESCPSPEQWPLISESSFENQPRPSVSEPALSARSDRRRPISRDNRRDMAARKAMDDSKMKIESPAPPPPSPEPKDRESGDARMRKDLRSRDSLTMAPLFEVAEMDESSPRDAAAGVRDQGQTGSRTVDRKHSKKIEVTVPGETEGEQEEGGEETAEEKGGEMISQMTVMHVIPKGRGGKGHHHQRRVGELERIQETFLNVDIPAEDVSSLKAEHGSSHQEDLSSSDTVVKSHTTGSDASPSPRGRMSYREPAGDNLGGTYDLEEEEEKGDANIGGENVEGQVDNDKTGEVVVVSGRKMSEKGGDEFLPDSYRERLDVSVDSMELMCDSARFISHDQVSPIEGENGVIDLGASPRFVLGGLGEMEEEVEGAGESAEVGGIERKPSLLGSLTVRLEKAQMAEDEEGEIEQGDKEKLDGNDENIKTEQETEGETGEGVQPPGVFFFQGSSSSEGSTTAAAAGTGTDNADGVDGGGEGNKDKVEGSDMHPGGKDEVTVAEERQNNEALDIETSMVADNETNDNFDLEESTDDLIKAYGEILENETKGETQETESVAKESAQETGNTTEGDQHEIESKSKEDDHEAVNIGGDEQELESKTNVEHQETEIKTEDEGKKIESKETETKENTIETESKLENEISDDKSKNMSTDDQQVENSHDSTTEQKEIIAQSELEADAELSQETEKATEESSATGEGNDQKLDQEETKDSSEIEQTDEKTQETTGENEV